MAKKKRKPRYPKLAATPRTRRGPKPTPPPAELPVESAVFLRCPTHLDAEAKREWKRVVPELQARGSLAKVDRAVLAAYCQSWSRLVDAEQHIVTEGLTVLTPNGLPVQSPWLQISNKAKDHLLKFAIQLGLSEKGRAGLPAKTTEKPEPVKKRERKRRA